MNIFKWIQQALFGIKSSKEVPNPCNKVIKELEKVKSSYISNEEFNSLTTEQQKTIIEQEISDAELQKNITSGNEPYLMGTSLDYKTGKPVVRERPIRFFTPEDNKKETTLNEKKASEIKKKRQYKKKKK